MRPSFTGLAPPPIATFSASAGSNLSADLGAHEFGHALFSLSDEYNEPTEDRLATAAIQSDIDFDCCCISGGDPGGGVAPGSGIGIGSGGTVGGVDIGVTPKDFGNLYCLTAGGNLELAGTGIPGQQPPADTPDC